MRLFFPPLAAAAALVVAAFAAAAPVRASDLVGPESCRTCHAEAYRLWAQSPHARAAAALEGDQRRSPLCLYCHSRDEARSGAAQVTNVSCETCHGGGRFYQPAVVMRDKELSRLFGLVDLNPQTTQASCQVCHGGDSPSTRPFDFKEALARIDHWTADRAARKEQRTGLLPAVDPHRAKAARLATWLREGPGPQAAP
ncbi:MAG: hypothetical protein NVS2B9_21480 [Myxococcales bacterium]